MKFLDFLATGESPICLADASKALPPKPNGKKLSIQAIERYITAGYGPEGAKTFLEGARVANSWCTSREALQRFVKACTDADMQSRQVAPAKKQKSAFPKRSRGERASRARRELAAAGWGSKKKKPV